LPKHGVDHFLAKTNANFERYYYDQNICAHDEEWAECLAAMRRPLPQSFRINSARLKVAPQLVKLLTHYSGKAAFTLASFIAENAVKINGSSTFALAPWETRQQIGLTLIFFLVKQVSGRGPELRESEKTVLYLQIIILISYYILLLIYQLMRTIQADTRNRILDPICFCAAQGVKANTHCSCIEIIVSTIDLIL